MTTANLWVAAGAALCLCAWGCDSSEGTTGSEGGGGSATSSDATASDGGEGGSGGGAAGGAAGAAGGAGGSEGGSGGSTGAPDGGGEPDAPGSSDTGGDPGGPPPIAETLTTFIGDWEMQPGKETTRCVVKRLDNAEVAWVTQIRTELAKGSHHMVIYKSQETEERTEPFKCTPFVETISGETFPLMITQIAEETLSFPPGVAFRFEPNQMVRIEAHYLNYYPEPITAHGDVHFDTIAEEDVVDEANMLFYGTPDFQIPAGQSYTTPWFFLDVLEGSKIFAITGHTHQYGTNVEIDFADDASSPADPVYPLDEAYDWEEPPVIYYDPPLEFSGGQGLRYRCSWTNTSNSSVGFGESANKEMCFFWAYYYPSEGYRLCVNPGGLGGGALGNQICCPGSFWCDILKSYL